ncbi:MAG: alanine:cation symporter family protein, partial [Clostridia bacterium]|nr:alanine:cation symporter family protein [Clostridia bacterium]
GQSAEAGVIEVLFDTVLLCMLTGLSALCVMPDITAYGSGMELILSAFYSSFGDGGLLTLSLCVALFAICTTVCWYYYATVALGYIFKRSFNRVFKYVYFSSILVGAFISGKYLVKATHVILLFLTVLTSAALIKNSERVCALSEKYRLKIKGSVCEKESKRQGRSLFGKALQRPSRKGGR